MNIYEKLNVIQFKLKAPKSQYNSFGKFAYRNCEDILEAVKPLLSEVGAILTISDDIALIGERYYVKATASLTDVSGEGEITNVAFAREENERKNFDASQLTGSTSSYARKYALNGLFAIDDTRDADALNNGNQPLASPKTSNQEVKKEVESQKEPKVEQKEDSDYQLAKEREKEILAIIDGTSLKMNDVKKWISAKNYPIFLNKLTEGQYKELCIALIKFKQNK